MCMQCVAGGVVYVGGAVGVLQVLKARARRARVGRAERVPSAPHPEERVGSDTGSDSGPSR